MFQVFSKRSASLLNKSQRTHPYIEVLKMLFVLMMVCGWAKWNSWTNSLFRLMNAARFSIKSFVTPLIEPSILVPRCLAEDTHGRSFPFIFRDLNSRSTAVYARHLVLHFLGSGFVLKAGSYSSRSRLSCPEDLQELEK